MPSEVKAQDTTSLASIKTVNEAATQSRALLAGMERAAADADTTLNGIYQDAKDAQTAADSAEQSADTAYTNLQQIQSVLEVAQWIATHGTYVKATVFNPNATYYTITAMQVTEPSDDDKDSQGVLIYYELDNGIYVRTTDTSVDDQKTYYRVTGTPVAQPSAEHIADYYILAVSEAMADYVQSHLALTNDGLYVMADNSEWKVLIRATGIDIIDGTGATDVVVATFDNDGTTFYDGQGTDNTNITAEFSTSGVRIGSEASTSRASVSPEGFVIEDDNLLTVTEIGKGETIVNHYEYSLENGDMPVSNYEQKVFYENETYTVSGIDNPTGVITLRIPYAKYSSSGEKIDSGVIPFVFDAGVTDVVVDDTGTLRATYFPTYSKIEVKLLDASHYQSYVIPKLQSRKTINSSSSMPTSIFSFRSYHLVEGVSVRVRLTVLKSDGNTFSINTSWGYNELPTSVGGSSRNATMSYTDGGKSVTLYLRIKKTTSTSFRLESWISRNVTAYVTTGSSMALDYNALVLDGKPSMDYYASAEAPFYSFGQRIGDTKGAYSLISGQGLEAQYPYNVVFGSFNDNQSDNALEIGNGSSENNRSNAFTVDWDGIVSARDKDNRFSDIFDLLRPVGSTYSTVDASFDPNDSWGGTWEKLPEGYVLLSGSESGSYQVGTDTTTSGYKEYGANDKRIEDANIAHGHGFTQPTITSYYRNAVSYSSGSAARPYTSSGSSSTTDWAKASGGSVHNLGTPSQRADFNVMQKSIAVYTWIRTA